ncbi:gasdermin-A2 [Amia ocellicauda]|uniref:gasdermin-A2 n=1 Tax=Amia ocellicauda TaxID=2972642 RepID=UPI0034642E3A|nr:GSDME protein [Amia calva]
MFHKATQFLTRELDPTGNLVPVRSISTSFQFETLCLVRKVVPFWPWRPNKYLPTSVKLQDVLQDTDTVDVGSSPQLKVTLKTSSQELGRIRGKVTANYVEVDSKASLDMSNIVGSFSVELIDISLNKLAEELDKIKLNLNHWLLQKLSKARAHGLGVVTQSIKARSKLLINKSLSGSGSLTLNIQPVTKVEADMRGNTNQEMVVEEGTILAFKVYDLGLHQDGTVDAPSTPTRSKCFFSDGLESRSDTEFMGMKDDIDREISELSNLDRVCSTKIWTLLCQLLPHENALAVLEYMITQHMDKVPPDVDCLDEGVNQHFTDLLEFLGWSGEDAEQLPNELNRSIAFLVNAMDNLDEQTVLEIPRLNTEERKQQIEHVEGMLKQECCGRQPEGEEALGAEELSEEMSRKEADKGTPPRHQRDRLFSLYIVLRAVVAMGVQ